MTTGEDGTYYQGLFFHAVLEARWAAFFETHGQGWQYEAGGRPEASTSSYRPQLYLPHHGSYLEVRDRWDPHTRRPDLRHHSEAPEPCIFLAAGELPTDQQMRAIGWWDPQARRGVLQLTAGVEWESLFPPASSDVLAALEAARNETFELLKAMPRREGEGVSDPQREQTRRELRER